MDVIAAAQKRDFICALVDAEAVYDGYSIDWAKSRRVNTDELVVAKPETDEEALDCVLEFAKSGAVDLCIFDSVAALSPKAEADRDIEQETMALKARLSSKFFRKGTAMNALSQMATVFINQVRTDLGSYGSPEVTPGGKAIHFYASLELGLRRGPKANWPKVGDSFTGYQLVTKVNKTKISGTGFEGTEAVVNFSYANGIDPKEAIIFLAMEQGIISRKSEKSPIYVIDIPGKDPVEIKGKEHVLPAVKESAELYAAVEKAVITRLQ